MQILEFNPVNIRTARGSFSVKLNNGMIVSGLTLFKGENGYWVSPPSRKSQVGDEVKYVPFVSFEDPQVNKQFIEAAKTAVINYIDHHQIKLEEAPKAAIEPMPSPQPHPNDEGLPF